MAELVVLVLGEHQVDGSVVEVEVSTILRLTMEKEEHIMEAVMNLVDHMQVVPLLS